MIPGMKCREYIFHSNLNLLKKNYLKILLIFGLYNEYSIIKKIFVRKYYPIWYFRGANPLSNYPFFTDLQPPQKKNYRSKNVMTNNNYLKSFKVPSRIVTLATTLIIALLTYVAAMQPETLAAYLPGYEGYAAIIIVIAAALVNQYSEEKRVERAEEIAIAKSATVLGYPTEETVLNEEYVLEGDEN